MDIGDLLNACDIVTLPSLWEGLSISLLEAMAARKPVITTTIASNVEVVDGGGGALLVPPAATADLAEAIESLIGDARLRDDLGARGKRVFQTRYTAQRMVDGYIAIYQELCERKGVQMPPGGQRDGRAADA